MKQIAIILTLFTACCCQSAFAQFYIVQDADGYVNVRGKHGKIIDTVPTGLIVVETEEFAEWYNDNSLNVYYIKHNKLYAGQIHSSRLKDLCALPEATNKDEIFNLLPPSSYNRLIDLYLPSTRVYHDGTTQSYYLMMNGKVNSASESYTVMWIVKDGKYAGRHFGVRVGGDDGVGGDYFSWLAARKGIPLKKANLWIEKTDTLSDDDEK